MRDPPSEVVLEGAEKGMTFCYIRSIGTGPQN
jgi:hypothetical protein